MLSRTKATFMYAPGHRPLVFTAHGIRFGCALGMETHYPEIFTAYEELDVDCVLFSTAGNPGTPGADGHPPAGLVTPEGTWAARCSTYTAELAIADVDTGAGALAREWRRAARATVST
jgi:hypothetical protein